MKDFINSFTWSHIVIGIIFSVQTAFLGFYLMNNRARITADERLLYDIEQSRDARTRIIESIHQRLDKLENR